MSNISERLLGRVRRALEQFDSIPDEEWPYLAAKIKEIRLKRNSFLIGKEDRVDKVYFVCGGLMRVYYSKADGSEINRNFVFENRFFTNSLSFLTDSPSHYEVEVLEDAHLLYFTKKTLEELYLRHPVWNKIGRLAAEQDFIEKELKEVRFRLFSPEEHYRYLVSTNSQIINRVPQYHLASFLGITPEALSRIRRRLRDFNKASD